MSSSLYDFSLIYLRERERVDESFILLLYRTTILINPKNPHILNKMGTSTFCISVPTQMGIWIEEAQKAGLSPSRIFQDKVKELMEGSSSDYKIALEEEQRKREAWQNNFNKLREKLGEEEFLKLWG